MAKVEQFVCDECGTVKQQTNHWLHAKENSEGCLWFWPFDIERSAGSKDICGHACAQQVLERWMAEQRS